MIFKAAFSAVAAIKQSRIKKNLISIVQFNTIQSPNAAERIMWLMSKQSDPSITAVKVGVRRRGCNGLSYTLNYCDKPDKLDEVVEENGVRVVIDSKAVMVLVGTQIDYVKDDIKAEFVFKHPNQSDVFISKVYNKLNRDSRSQSKKDNIAITTASSVELLPPRSAPNSETPIESSEAQKINSLNNKQKNCSYFETTTALVEQDANVVATQQQPSINKYVTRISKGSVFPLKVKQQAPAPKRMNSPSDGLRKFNVNLVMDAGKLTIAAATIVSVFQQPYPEFQYYLSILKYYHNDKRYEQLIESAFNNSLKTLTYFKEIYQDHFFHSYHALQFCRNYNVSNVYLKKVVNLPNNKFQKTIVFDLDETLIHCKESYGGPANDVLTINSPTRGTYYVKINIRPYCKEMLQLLSQKYEIIVFTASHECYAQKVLNQIDPECKFIHYRFFRESCVVIKNGLHVKDLRIIGNRSLNDMVLVDNASYSFCFQPSNGIPIVPFYDNPLDRELIYLTNYLQELMQSADIPTKNNQHFKNHMYMEDTTIEQLITKL